MCFTPTDKCFKVIGRLGCCELFLVDFQRRFLPFYPFDNVPGHGERARLLLNDDGILSLPDNLAFEGLPGLEMEDVGFQGMGQS